MRILISALILVFALCAGCASPEEKALQEAEALQEWEQATWAGANMAAYRVRQSMEYAYNRRAQVYERYPSEIAAIRKSISSARDEGLRMRQAEALWRSMPGGNNFAITSEIMNVSEEWLSFSNRDKRDKAAVSGDSAEVWADRARNLSAEAWAEAAEAWGRRDDYRRDWIACKVWLEYEAKAWGDAADAWDRTAIALAAVVYTYDAVE